MEDRSTAQGRVTRTRPGAAREAQDTALTMTDWAWGKVACREQSY